MSPANSPAHLEGEKYLKAHEKLMIGCVHSFTDTVIQQCILLSFLISFKFGCGNSNLSLFIVNVLGEA